MVQGTLQGPAAQWHARAADAGAANTARRHDIRHVPHARRAHACLPHTRAHARARRRLHQHSLHSVRPDTVHDTIRDHAPPAGLPRPDRAQAQARADSVHGAIGLAKGGRGLGAAPDAARYALDAAKQRRYVYAEAG